MTKRSFLIKGFIFFMAVYAFFNPLSFCDITDDLKENAIKIAGETFIKNNTYKILRILSDEIGARLTGSESAHKAANFCLDRFKKYSLSNVHLEYFDTVGWIPGKSFAETLEPLQKTLVVDSMGLSINTSQKGLIDKVIDVGHGTEKDFKTNSPSIKGKIVLCGLKEPPGGIGRTKELEKIALAAKHEALACMIISRYIGKLTRTRTSANGEYSPIPAAAITYEDGTWMRRLLEDGKKVSVKLVIQNKIMDRFRSENVIADISGIEKQAGMVVLGAHLDSWNLGPGAADNGLGVAITLETARILSSLDLKPKRTIRFVLFTGEEQGLIGSRAYVKRHELELDNIILMVNLDITGKMYPGFINPYGGWDYRGKLNDLLRVLEGFGINQIYQKYPYDSDDFNFVAKGVPALGLQGRGERLPTYSHTYADTFDKIAVDKLNMTTAAIAITIYYAANRDVRFSKRLSQEEVIKFFKKKGLDVKLKKNRTWMKLGFPY